MLGAIAAYGGSRLPPVPGQQVGPDVFPMLIGGGLVLCGGMIAFGIGRRFEDEAEAELAAVEGPTEPVSTNPLYGLRVLIPPVLLIFYVLAIDRIGFILTAAAMTLAISLTLGARTRLALAVAVLAPVGTHLIFAKLLRVPLAAGFLPMPW